MRLALFLLPALAACSEVPARKATETVGASKVAAEARKLRLQPGQWETTTLITAMNVTGLPASATEAATGTRTTTSNCVTRAQAQRPQADLLAGTNAGNCTYQRFSMANARIDAAMTCAPAGLPGTMAMTLTGPYAPAGFTMNMAMKTDLPGDAAMTMRATVTGRRTGECTPEGETTG